jgi:hypothetical protein
MAALSIDQIAAVAANAGFTGPDLATAVAVALAESSGNASAYNPEIAAGAAPGQGSYGLWQIYLQAHPQFDPSQLMDPQYNANAAFAIYSSAGGSFAPWSTYKYGQYTNYLAQAQAATGGAAIATMPSDGTAYDGGAAASTDGTGWSGLDLSDPTTLATIALAGGLTVWLLFR